MAVMAILAARGSTTVIAIMSENSNYGQNGSNTKSNVIASANMSFAALDTYIIIADEYGHNDCDGKNRSNGNIGFLEINDLNGFNCCNS